MATTTSSQANDEVLSEAYDRLHRHGPEFGGDEEGNHGLTNHGPMAAEVMVRRGLDLDVHRWLDGYVPRLVDLPSAGETITAESWPAALGDGRRVGDWTAYFTAQLADAPWQQVLVTWWPRLLPGIAAGSTHGVIRTGHVVRTLLAADQASAPSPAAIAELANALAFWAARSRELPGLTAPAGTLRAADALAAVPRLQDQSGFIAHRLSRLADLPGWSPALAALEPAAADDVPARLADLIEAATRDYLAYGHASPVLLVHTATAPNAVLHILPALPKDQWPASLGAVWAAAAAITAAYAPAVGSYAPRGSKDEPDAPGATRVVETPDEVLDRAAWHRDEHVIKFADTAVDAYDRSGDPTLLAAAVHAGQLVEPPR